MIIGIFDFLILRIPILLFFLYSSILATAQALDSHRIVNWENAGLVTEIDNSSTVKNALHVGLQNEGNSDNSTLLNQLISNANAGTTFYFPAGFYLFTNSIALKSDITLVGDAGKTYFLFDSMPNGNGIVCSGNIELQAIKLNSGAYKQYSYLLAQNSGLKVGDIVYLADNDSSMVYSEWAVGSTGQILSVKSVVDDTLFLFNEVRRNYLINNEPFVRKINPISNVKIQNIICVRRDSTTAQTSNILLDKAYNCEIACVESYSTNFAHITISNALNINVRGSYFKNAQGYGGGGKGYGVALQFASSECKIFNNIFDHLRHSILLQAGANGNFIGYNYSKNPYWTETSLPSDAAGDLVLHGNYVYANLFEGNVVQNIVIDDSHGENGPNNVFLRNRAEGYGLFMNPIVPTDSQLFIGNEITNTILSKGLYSLAGSGHFEYGNNVLETCRPANTTDVTLNSLYFTSVPSEFDSTSSWPIIGYPTTIESFTNLAELRDRESQKVECVELTNGDLQIKETQKPHVFPNPSQNYFLISNLPDNAVVSVMNGLGQRLMHCETQCKQFYHHLSSGVYYVHIDSEKGESIQKLIVR